jgi:universal stress protein A
MAGYQKVLVLLDLSDDSEKVFIAGRTLAACSNASVVALHVVDYMPAEPMGETLMPTLSIEQDLAERSRTRLNELVTRYGLPHAICRVEVGNTKAEILRVAKEEGALRRVGGAPELAGGPLLRHEL